MRKLIFVVSMLIFCELSVADDLFPYFVGQVDAPRGLFKDTHFTSSGEYLVTSSRRPFVGRIFSIPDMKLLLELNEEEDGVFHFAFNEVKEEVLLLMVDRTLRVRDLTNSSIKQRVSVDLKKFKTIHSVGVSPQGDYYYGTIGNNFEKSAGPDIYWSATDYTQLNFPGSTISSTGKYIFWGRLYDMPQGKKVKALKKYKADFMCFSADDRYLALAKRNGPLQLIDLHNMKKGNIFSTLQDERVFGTTPLMMFSPNNSILLVADDRFSEGGRYQGSKITLYSTIERKMLISLQVESHATNGNVHHFSFSPDENYLLLTDRWKGGKIYDIENDRFIAIGNRSSRFSTIASNVYLTSPDEELTLRFDDDGFEKIYGIDLPWPGEANSRYEVVYSKSNRMLAHSPKSLTAGKISIFTQDIDREALEMGEKEKAIYHADFIIGGIASVKPNEILGVLKRKNIEESLSIYDKYGVQDKYLRTTDIKDSLQSVLKQYRFPVGVGEWSAYTRNANLSLDGKMNVTYESYGNDVYLAQFWFSDKMSPRERERYQLVVNTFLQYATGSIVTYSDYEQMKKSLGMGDKVENNIDGYYLRLTRTGNSFKYFIEKVEP